jgi:hypothetical protein
MLDFYIVVGICNCGCVNGILFAADKADGGRAEDDGIPADSWLSGGPAASVVPDIRRLPADFYGFHRDFQACGDAEPARTINLLDDTRIYIYNR